jgi:hypothetical protein
MESKILGVILRTLSQICSISPQASQITASQEIIINEFQNNSLKAKHHNNGLALPASTNLDSAVTLGQRRKEFEKAWCSLASVNFSQEKKPSLSGPFHVKLFSGWQIATVVGMAPSPTWQHAAEAECSLPCKHRQSTMLSRNKNVQSTKLCMGLVLIPAQYNKSGGLKVKKAMIFQPIYFLPISKCHCWQQQHHLHPRSPSPIHTQHRAAAAAAAAAHTVLVPRNYLLPPHRFLVPGN